MRSRDATHALKEKCLSGMYTDAATVRCEEWRIFPDEIHAITDTQWALDRRCLTGVFLGIQDPIARVSKRLLFRRDCARRVSVEEWTVFLEVYAVRDTRCRETGAWRVSREENLTQIGVERSVPVG